MFNSESYYAVLTSYMFTLFNKRKADLLKDKAKGRPKLFVTPNTKLNFAITAPAITAPPTLMCSEAMYPQYLMGPPLGGRGGGIIQPHLFFHYHFN